MLLSSCIGPIEEKLAVTRCHTRRRCPVCSGGVSELRSPLIGSALGEDDARWSGGVYLALRAIFNEWYSAIVSQVVSVFNISPARLDQT